MLVCTQPLSAALGHKTAAEHDYIRLAYVAVAASYLELNALIHTERRQVHDWALHFEKQPELYPNTRCTRTHIHPVAVQLIHGTQEINFYILLSKG